jgi:hypothetical protein
MDKQTAGCWWIETGREVAGKETALSEEKTKLNNECIRG